MIIQNRYAGHSKVHVLARLPSHLGRNRNFDCVFGHESDSSLVTNQEGVAPWLQPVEFKTTHKIRKHPDNNGGVEVVPSQESILRMPEQEANIYNASWHMKNNKHFVRNSSDPRKRRHTKPNQRYNAGSSRPVYHATAVGK
uniref:Uncharacterized protein n=1 Tax=Photinus pyralis TaxID=7054 RepID=A0A1Y1KJ82_PHOPY